MKRLLPLALLVLGAGCGGSGTATTAAPAPAASSAPAAEATALPALKKVALEGGSRVVFTFSRRVAHARTRPVEAFYADASGRPVAVKGKALLVVRFEPARMHAYSGPTRIEGHGPVVEVVAGGDFEGLVTWAIGLDRTRAYTVTRSGAKVVLRIGR